MVTCAETNYLFQGLAALFGMLFTASEAIAFTQNDNKCVLQLLICSCTKGTQKLVEAMSQASNNTPRTSFESQRPRGRSCELERIPEAV